MPEFTSNALQTVAAGQNVLFTETAVPCTIGAVLHREGSGNVTLRPRTCSCGCSSETLYKVSFGANIAIPTGGTVGAISLAIAINGEPIPTSSMIVTPAAVEEFWNVYASVFVSVPAGCCLSVAVENTSAEAISVQNANIIIE